MAMSGIEDLVPQSVFVEFYAGIAYLDVGALSSQAKEKLTALLSRFLVATVEVRFADRKAGDYIQELRQLSGEFTALCPSDVQYRVDAAWEFANDAGERLAKYLTIADNRNGEVREIYTGAVRWLAHAREYLLPSDVHMQIALTLLPAYVSGLESVEEAIRLVSNEAELTGEAEPDQ